MATLNYAQLYEQTLFQAYFDPMKFSDLWNTLSNQQVKFIGAKTVNIPHIDVQGATDVNRDTITAFARNVDNSYEAKTLAHDREFSTLVDPEDVDETNMAITIANIADVYNREQKVPELDKFMISKLYSEAVRLGNAIDASVLGDSGTDVDPLQLFDNFMQAMDEGEVPDTGRILYVTPATHNLMKNSNRLTRMQQVQNTDGAVSRTILSLDGVEVVVVPSNRMKTLYDFTNGAVVATGAKQIQMALIHPSALLAPMKYEFVNLEEPSALSKGKFVYYERFYCDVFAFDRRAAGIQISAV